MLPDFATWMESADFSIDLQEAAPVAANFLNVVAQPDDFIYFDVHGLEDYDPAHPLDVRKMVPWLGKVVGYAGDSKVIVTPPQQHRFKSSSIKTDRSGNWVVNMGQVHEITSRLLAGGGFDKNAHSGELRKLFLYTPKPYHMKLLSNANKKMAAYASQQQAKFPQDAPQSQGNTAKEDDFMKSFLSGGEQQPKPQTVDLTVNAGPDASPLAARVKARNEPKAPPVPNPHGADPSYNDPLRDMFSAKPKPLPTSAPMPALRRRMMMPQTGLRPTGTSENTYGYKLIGEASRAFYPYFEA